MFSVEFSNISVYVPSYVQSMFSVEFFALTLTLRTDSSTLRVPQFAYEFNDTNGELEVFADADYAAGEEKGGKETPCPVCDAVCGAVVV